MQETDFLYAQPSFIGGVAAVLDMGGTLREYNASPNGEIADARAIMSDWIVTGNDIRSAIGIASEQADD